MSSKKRMGILLMAYGTPRKPEDLEPYYTHIRRGRKPSPELLEDLKARYEAIGGISPLARITEEQVAKVEHRLNEVQNDIEFRAYLGLKHIDPFIEDAVSQMHQEGIEEAISLVLAPHYSTFSVKSYNGRAQEKAAQLGGLHIESIDSWYKEPKFIEYWVQQLQQTFAQIPADKHEKTVVIFSAHSLPEKILQLGDPYPQQLQETADLVAQAAGIRHYAVGWQSAGNTPDPWLGPDVQDLTRQLHQEKGYTSFVYCPLGFVADHLEVLYDNDIECKMVCDELGADYYRPEMPNAKPEFIDCLVTVILKQLKKKASVRV
ncbi:ferrochelatase [Thermoflavimicrobium dichotomicum]|uniref:Coproporphyrin III ferrochelatase n=1 Tax=Thermoflavimicrobium dichotomicum TaxID=46223 RepID=A0A1I3S1F1_9BACL|nr:ferrochelatase [Thermoflavimicrobium dichotomicum]SFJ51407.1 ferrochelatase [Thermoflavimicrobium dichotomicum]